MPLSEEDIYRKEIDDAVADVKQQIQTSKAHGVSPRMPDYEELFGKIVKSATRDPRMTPRTVENIKDHAKKKYKDLAVHAGLKGDIVMEAHVLRGLQVHVAILVDRAAQPSIITRAFSDERDAINAVDQFLEKNEVGVSHHHIVEYVNKWQGAKECPEHPLEHTQWYGTRVETCTIN
jgi:hypothetical protein